jgi:altronate dehydratase small subunit
MSKVLVINKEDNVATAIKDINENEIVSFLIGHELKNIRVKEKILFGHKFALKKINKGGKVIKYGESIGKATENINLGYHVHIHNTESEKGRGDLKHNLKK